MLEKSDDEISANLQTFSGEEVSIGSNPQINNLFFNMNINPFPIFRLNSGIRFSKYKNYNKSIINPKVSLKYNPTSEIALKLGYEFSGDELLRFSGKKVGKVTVKKNDVPGEYN